MKLKNFKVKRFEHFTYEEIQMANIHIKWYSTLLLIIEVQVKNNEILLYIYLKDKKKFF